VDVPVETRGVVGVGDADVTGVYLGLALEGFFDLGLHLAWADLRRDDDVVADAHHTAHVLDHPLDLKPLVLPFHLPVERYPAGSHQRTYLALGNLGVIQDVGDRPGDVRVVARFPGGLDCQLIGDGLDAVHPRGGTDRRELLRVGRHGAREGYRPVLDGDADSIRIGHLRVPPQLLDDFFPDLAVGFHRLPLGDVHTGFRR
jgi:hypothetical protein